MEFVLLVKAPQHAQKTVVVDAEMAYVSVSVAGRTPQPATMIVVLPVEMAPVIAGKTPSYAPRIANMTSAETTFASQETAA